MKDDSNNIKFFTVPPGQNGIYVEAAVILNPGANFGETWTFTIPGDPKIYTGLEYGFHQTASQVEADKSSADTLFIQLNLLSDWKFFLPDCFIRNQSKGPTLQICKANESNLWLEVNNPYLNDSSTTTSSDNNFRYGLQFLVANTKDQHFYLSTDPQVTVTKLPPPN